MKVGKVGLGFRGGGLWQSSQNNYISTKTTDVGVCQRKEKEAGKSIPGKENSRGKGREALAQYEKQMPEANVRNFWYF